MSEFSFLLFFGAVTYDKPLVANMQQNTFLTIERPTPQVAVLLRDVLSNDSIQAGATQFLTAIAGVDPRSDAVYSSASSPSPPFSTPWSFGRQK